MLILLISLLFPFKSAFADNMLLGNYRGILPFSEESKYPEEATQRKSGYCQTAYDFRLGMNSLNLDFGFVNCGNFSSFNDLNRSFEIRGKEIFEGAVKRGTVLNDGTFHLEFNFFKKEKILFTGCFKTVESYEYEVPGKIIVEIQPLPNGSFRYLREVNRSFLQPTKKGYKACDSEEEKRAAYALGRYMFKLHGILAPKSP